MLALHVAIMIAGIQAPGSWEIAAHKALAPHVGLLAQDQLFRSTEHRFRIKFPAGWTVKDGDGAHVVKKATYSGATVLVLVRELVTREAIAEFRRERGARARKLSHAQVRERLEAELDIRSFSRSDLTRFTHNQADEIRTRFPGTRMEVAAVRHLDNRPAAYVQAVVPYTALDRTVNVRSMSYTLIYRGRLYQVQAAAPVESFDRLFPSMYAAMGTFVIEDW